MLTSFGVETVGRKGTCGFVVIGHLLKNKAFPCKTRVAKQPKQLHGVVLNHIHTLTHSVEKLPACSGAYS